MRQIFAAYVQAGLPRQRMPAGRRRAAVRRPAPGVERIDRRRAR